MKYLIKDINKEEKEKLDKMGLYCYDLRESDMGDEIANVERSVFVNKVGNMVTNEEIKFDKSPKDFVNYFDFCMKNERVERIEDLIETKEIDVEKILKETKELLKSNEDYEEMEIYYILEDTKDKNETIVIAMKDQDIAQIKPFTKEIYDVADWAYNIDEDVFKELEGNKKIAYMSMDMHYNMWETIKAWYPEDIENKKGMQKYLEFCKKNNITKERIENETKLYGVTNVMKYYKKDKKKDDR